MDDKTRDNGAYQKGYTDLYLGDEEFVSLDLDLDDDQLNKMLVQSLESDRDYWNQRPWNLKEVDETYPNFVFGDQLTDDVYLKNDIKYQDNRIFTAVRSILSYATGQLARPEITPSKDDEINRKGARDIQAALYQHSIDEKVDFKVRSAVMNLVTVKRGYLKLRFDPNLGLNGDIVTDIVNPEDIIISKTAGYLGNPDKIYQRLHCTIDELCMKFPDKADDIYAAFSIQRGTYSQVSRLVYYFECTFTYIDGGKPCEGVAWFIPEKKLILDKMKNPNWIYTGNDKKDREVNLTSFPPKGYIPFNYINKGHSYIDETSLVEQAIPQQKMLNKRGRQIMENADYVNGRWVANKQAFGEEDAQKLINKGARTVALVTTDDVNKALANISSEALPPYVENTLYDARTEIDQIMGTPTIFRGAQQDQSNTLGQDLIIKQQAGALQDDLVKAITNSMETYFTVKLQMMKTYYTEDHAFQLKGGDGKYEFITLNGENMDSNVKVSVQVDSTLPNDKASVRQTAMDLWKAGEAIDYRTFMEDLGLPDPEVRTERYLKSKLDPINYLKSIQLTTINSEAEADIQLLIANQTPEEADSYSDDYFNYYNSVIASNRFAKWDVDVQQRVTAFLIAIQHAMMRTVNLNTVMMDAAGISNAPTPMPLPQVSEKLTGLMDPDQVQTATGQPAPQAPPPVPTQ